MHLCRPIRGPRLSLTSFGMCRSTRPSSNSRSFCTYKITSHLHIPQLLKVPQFQSLAPKSLLTPFVCADGRNRGGGGPRSDASRLDTNPPYRKPLCFQSFTHSQFPSPLFPADYALRGVGRGSPSPQTRMPANRRSPASLSSAPLRQTSLSSRMPSPFLDDYRR